MAGPQPPGTPPTDAPDRIPPDALLDGRYHVTRVLGTGGFGRVYLAVDTRLEREVAIKELLADRQQDRATYDRYLERFQREARAGSALRSENVVTVYDLHVDAAQNYYLVMEYVEGQDLSDLLAQVGTLPLERALAIALDIAQALDAIHEQDTVHRDIKPANILITLRGVAKLTDFGLAQVAHESQRSQIATRHPGTPVYMSPEQRVGYGYIDGRSDLYSLGLVLHEMLTGQRFGETGQPLRAARPDMPPAVVAIVEKLLQEDRDDRYQSARALRDDLALVAAQPDTPVAALPGLRAALVPAVPTQPTLPAPPPSIAPPLPPPVGFPAAPPPFPAPPPARGGPSGLRIALIGGGVALCVLFLLAFALLTRPGGGQRGPSPLPIPVGSAAPVGIAPTPTERGEGGGETPTRAEPTATPATAASSVPTPAATPAATSAVATPAMRPPSTQPAPASTARPSGGQVPAAPATATIPLPVAPAGSARPLTDPTPTDSARRAESAGSGIAAAAGIIFWQDARSLLQLAVPRGWQIGTDRATPGNTLTVTGPDGGTLSVDIYDTPEGSVAEAVGNQRRSHGQSTEFRYADAPVIDLVIGGEPAKTMAYTYAPRTQTNLSAVRAGQVWIVIHGGKQYVFTADLIGADRAPVEAIVASARFLR